MAEERIFTLVGKFDDQITKKLKGINDNFASLRKTVKSFSKDIAGVRKDFDKLGDSFSSAGKSATKSFNRITESLGDAGRAAGKVRDTVSQIGEGVRGLDGISESLEGAARAAARAEENVYGIGEAAGKANRQADGLMETLLKANALASIGDGMAQGFSRGMTIITGTARKGAGIVAKQYRSAMEDQMADIKAQSGIQGSFTMAGFKGSEAGGGVSFKEAGRMYKEFDREIADMIRTSAAPTAKVVELQRYTLDTIGPLVLAAEGVAKGSDIRKIDPKKVKQSAQTYGAFLEKAALLSQGTGSAGFRVAGGIEQLVKRGKIDTTIDFFTDNILLMETLKKEGFAGRGETTSKLMGKSDAERFAAMLKAFEGAQSGEATKAMATSVQGSMQALEDTLFNSTVGILGMATTFDTEEQKKVNTRVKSIYGNRIKAYEEELKDVKTSEKRKEQIRVDILQTQQTMKRLLEDGGEITTPFLAMNLAFTQVVQKLTEALAAIGPIWNAFSIGVLDFSMKYIQPIADNLKNVASDIRGGMPKPEAFGRIVGEIVKGLGEALGAIGQMIADPKGPINKIQNEFVKGFMAAFKNDPGLLNKAKEGISKGLWAIFNKLLEFFLKIITLPELRPLVLGAFAIIFGPPLISAIIAGLTPLIITSMGGLLKRIVQIAITNLGTPKPVVPVAVKDLGSTAAALPPTKIKGLLPPAGGTTTTAVPAAVKETPGLFARLGQSMRNFLTTTFPTFTAAFKSAPATIRGFVLSLRGGLASLPSLFTVIRNIGDIARTGLPGGAVLPRLFATFSKGLTSVVTIFRGLKGGLANPLKTLGKFGGILTVVVTAFDVFANLLSGKDIFQSLAKSAPALIGTIVGAAFGPVGAIIGGMFGQWLSGFKPLTDFLEGLFRGIGFGLTELWNSGAPVFDALVGIISSLWNSFVGLIPGLDGVSSGFDVMKGTLALVATLFFPFISALNAVVVVLYLLKLAVLEIDKFINKIFQGGDRQGRIQAEINKTQGSIAETAQRQADLNAKTAKLWQDAFNNKPKPTEKPVPATRRGARPEPAPTPAKSTGTPQPALPKVTTPAATPINMGPLVDSAKATATNVQQVNVKAAQQVTQLSQINAKTTAANTANNASPQKISQTAANTASVKTSSTSIQKNTAVTNKILGELKSAAIAISNKVTTVNSSIINMGNKLNGLGQLKPSVDRIFSLMNSGSMRVKAAFGGTMSKMGGSGVDKFNPFAAQFGLGVTSGFRPGDPGWHGVNRARDYAGSPGSMMKFAQAMMGYPGLKELIYSPMGIGIRNGAPAPISSFGSKVVADHYDHVHVAYANGLGNGMAFNTFDKARDWEKANVPPSVKVASITGNSAEGFGGGTYTINAPITINQLPGQDSKTLASLVAMELSMAIDELRNHTTA